MLVVQRASTVTPRQEDSITHALELGCTYMMSTAEPSEVEFGAGMTEIVRCPIVAMRTDVFVPGGIRAILPDCITDKVNAYERA